MTNKQTGHPEGHASMSAHASYGRQRPASSLIRVRGARMHNLQNLDVDLPRGKFVVVTGVSGSGKSSLAFDTLFVEGQRRFLETLSSQTRAYLDQMQRADVDEIEGLPPTLSVEQHVGRIHPRSTLATTTGIHDFFRLLYARAGTSHCPNCGRELSQQSPQAIVDTILDLEAGKKVMIVAPLVRGKKGMHRELFEKIARDGFIRARVDGQIIDVGTPLTPKKSKPHDIDVIVDRIVVKDGLRPRLQESVQLALRLASGSCIISHEVAGGWHDRLYSSRFACPDCQLGFPEIEPRTFSFNSPYGACPTCEGMGWVSDESAPLAGWSEPAAWPAKHRSDDERRTSCSALQVPCPECGGARLAAIGRAVTLAEVPLHSILAQSVGQAEDAVAHLLAQLNASAGGQSVLEGHTTKSSSLFQPAAGRFTSQAALVAIRLLPEIRRRLKFLREVGVDYLTLDRPTNTLSGGEYQRARIAGCLGGGLIGVCYILDEPTIGLHSHDTTRLLDSLFALRDQGNSLIVVEHDLEVMARADYLVDLGPGAGREGGRVVASGAPASVARDRLSLTGQYLGGRFEPSAESSRAPSVTQPRVARGALRLAGATARNLKNLSVEFPLGCLTCVTGLSGSGKSTLVMETLVPLLRAELAAREAVQTREPPSVPPLAHDGSTASLGGAEQIDRLVEIDQSPLGRNARSNPATASGIWDEIRRLFARSRDARVRGFRASRFSFSAAGGRCEECRGQGVRRVSMQFLPDMEIVCPVCRGARFNHQTLRIKFRGRSVADVLAMRIDEATRFFENFAGLFRQLKTFVDVGLGYLALGQSATTLSGGEAQRIKLAAELGRQRSGRGLYVLDEPTTGLHPADVERLLDLLGRLIGKGHSVIVVEHNLDVVAHADWVIDLGPDGGPTGGQIVVAGPPLDVVRTAASRTGQALSAFLRG